MPEVTINDLILARGPGVTTDTSVGTTYTYDENPDLTELKDVRDGLVFETPDGTFGEIVPVGSTVEIDGVTYTLTGVHEFWGTYTKLDPETGETFTQQGQTVALTLEDANGNAISFLSPSDTFNIDDPWAPGEIVSIEVSSPPLTRVKSALHRAPTKANWAVTTTSRSLLCRRHSDRYSTGPQAR